MTSISEPDIKGPRRRTRVRTLGLPASAERALMGKAYENYATAQRLHVEAHNALRRALRKADYRGRAINLGPTILKDAGVKRALSKATETSFYLADAKAQYRAARHAAELAEVAA